jgi:ParB family transcriptional regulator, chromosome partitioning protein
MLSSQSPDTDITSKDISGEYVAGAIAEIGINMIDANPFSHETVLKQKRFRNWQTALPNRDHSTCFSKKTGIRPLPVDIGRAKAARSFNGRPGKIPAYIRVANDQQMLEMALVENIQRQDLNPLAIAISFQRLLEECKFTQEQLSDRVSKNRSTIANYIRLLKLPVEIQVALRDNKITMGHARALINVSEPATQIAILNKTLGNELSVRQVEELVRKAGQDDKTEKSAKPVTGVSEKLKNLKETLKQRFEAPVDIQQDNKGKGKIVIGFSNEEEMERIVSLLKK